MTLHRIHLALLAGITAAAFSLTALAKEAESCAVFKSPSTATFYGSFKGWRVDATQTLEKLSDQQWKFSLRAENPVGSIHQRSQFKVAPSGNLLTQQYRHQRNVLLKTEITETTFDWKTRGVECPR